ncbi:MAG: HAD family acid phosphatase [Gemmatimonadota bacterium]
MPFALVTLAAACHSGAPTMTPSAVVLPNDVKWVRTAAEYPALTLEIYRTATAYVRDVSGGLPAGSWVVILDVDETILDNSEHQRRMALAGVTFSDRTWTPWVRERAAPAVPGAVAFVHAVQAAGGRIAVVTNRADSLCADTRSNLESVGVRADLVLCQPVGPSDKNPRFEQVRQGSARAGFGPLRVIAFIGDNVQDFPGLSQDAREAAGALDQFGQGWFMLPNPMYGSWQRNADR